MTRYLCTGARCDIPYVDGNGHRGSAVVMHNELTPETVTSADAAPFLEAGLLRQITNEEAARPRPRSDPHYFAFGW